MIEFGSIIKTNNNYYILSQSPTGSGKFILVNLKNGSLLTPFEGRCNPLKNSINNMELEIHITNVLPRHKFKVVGTSFEKFISSKKPIVPNKIPNAVLSDQRIVSEFFTSYLNGKGIGIVRYEIGINVIFEIVISESSTRFVSFLNDNNYTVQIHNDHIRCELPRDFIRRILDGEVREFR
jgi:hypothetical protein